MKYDPYWKTMFGFMNRKDKEMKDDSLSDAIQYCSMCDEMHSKANDCRIPLNLSNANCPHGIAMDIYCEKCAEVNVKKDGGYCPHCRTVYAFPHDCNLIVGKSEVHSVLNVKVWNSAIEAAANDLKSSYPDHAAINAYCAAIRSLKK